MRSLSLFIWSYQRRTNPASMPKSITSSVRSRAIPSVCSSLPLTRMTWRNHHIFFACYVCFLHLQEHSEDRPLSKCSPCLLFMPTLTELFLLSSPRRDDCGRPIFAFMERTCVLQAAVCLSLCPYWTTFFGTATVHSYLGYRLFRKFTVCTCTCCLCAWGRNMAFSSLFFNHQSLVALLLLFIMGGMLLQFVNCHPQSCSKRCIAYMPSA